MAMISGDSRNRLSAFLSPHGSDRPHVAVPLRSPRDYFHAKDTFPYSGHDRIMNMGYEFCIDIPACDDRQRRAMRIRFEALLKEWEIKTEKVQFGPVPHFQWALKGFSSLWMLRSGQRKRYYKRHAWPDADIHRLSQCGYTLLGDIPILRAACSHVNLLFERVEQLSHLYEQWGCRLHDVQTAPPYGINASITSCSVWARLTPPRR